MKKPNIRLKPWFTRGFWVETSPVLIGLVTASVACMSSLAGWDLRSWVQDHLLASLAIALFAAFAFTAAVVRLVPRYLARRRLRVLRKRLARIEKTSRPVPDPPVTGPVFPYRRFQRYARIRLEIRALKTCLRRLSKPLVWS